MIIGPNPLSGSLRFGFTPRGNAPQEKTKRPSYFILGLPEQFVRFGFIPTGNAPAPPSNRTPQRTLVGVGI